MALREMNGSTTSLVASSMRGSMAEASPMSPRAFTAASAVNPSGLRAELEEGPDGSLAFSLPRASAILPLERLASLSATEAEKSMASTRAGAAEGVAHPTEDVGRSWRTMGLSFRRAVSAGTLALRFLPAAQGLARDAPEGRGAVAQLLLGLHLGDGLRPTLDGGGRLALAGGQQRCDGEDDDDETGRTHRAFPSRCGVSGVDRGHRSAPMWPSVVQRSNGPGHPFHLW